MVIDNQIKAKAWQICHDIFGEKATGVYGNKDVMEYGDEYEVSFSTNLEDGEVGVYHRTDLYVAWGASKLVIVPLNENFVIKVDMTGTYDWNAEEEKYELIDTLNMDESSLPEEERLYNNASNELKQILVPVHYVFDYNRKIPVYVQEKYNMNLNDIYEEDLDPFYDGEVNGVMPKSVEARIKELADTCYLRDHQYFIYNIWLKRFGFSTTMKIAKELIDYSDLHNGNMAVMNDGVVKICDYAGYDHYAHWDNSSYDYCSSDEDSTTSSHCTSSGRS